MVSRVESESRIPRLSAGVVGLCLGLAVPLDAQTSETPRDAALEPGTPGGPGLALRCAKLLTADSAREVIDDGLVLVQDGRILRVGAAGELDVPESFVLRDVGDSWIMPGMVDLHSHIAGSGINDGVYQSNTGLRAACTVVPDNAALQRGCAAGVTTILYIPGSATNFGGEGVLLKTGLPRYEDMLVREHGSLKLAQADNPKRWGWGMGRLSLNWQIRDTLQRGMAYAERWRAFESGETTDEPDTNPQWEIFRHLASKDAQISAHTQAYQVVYQTIRIVRQEFGIDVFIDHGTMDGFLAAELAEAEGVPAILGPRSISGQNKGRGIDHDGKLMGVAAEYQRRGHSQIGFNTDAPVIPQEELGLQAAMGVRYGFDDSEAGTIHGLTIVPARVAGIDDRVGSIEPGKHADLVVIDGHPADPRNAARLVFIEGRLAYDAEEGRKW